MKIIKTPKADRYFWTIHFSIWGALASINFINRQVAEMETLEHGLYSALDIILVNTLVCLFFRRLIHQFNWTNARNISTWLLIIGSSFTLGIISAIFIVLGLGVYLLAYGYTSTFMFFWNDALGNWLIMSIMIFLWAVVYILANYLNQLKIFELNESEMALRLKQAQLNNLVGQLNPHFLFNGLNNIRALMLEDVNRSREMLTALSELLRYSLQSNNKVKQPIIDEVEIVRSYIELAKIQYEQRLVYSENIDESLLEQPIPPLLIQLLIENAIRHGIDRSIDGGKLSLSIKRLEDQIQIQVCNPGSLASPEPAPNKSTGLGLKNIKRRLALLYDGKASLQIQEKSQIVCATILLPYSDSFENTESAMVKPTSERSETSK